MRARIVLFLGTFQDAQPARYLSPGATNPATDRVVLLPWASWVASIRAARADAEIDVVVIGSEVTRSGWEFELGTDAGAAGFADRARIPIGFVRYEETALNPANDVDYWRFLDLLRRVLAGEPIGDRVESLSQSPMDGFQQRADEILLDITRGFRAAPLSRLGGTGLRAGR